MSEPTVTPPSPDDASSSAGPTEVGPGTPARKLRDTMECVVLAARPGAKVSDRPPVEIFLGTEPAQYRANRVFGWSIEKVRNPGREVRIYLMSELDGFDRRGWTTGFTNFRFAIPAYQGGCGRAIYNDEDQIYLTDPGELFDLDLGEAATLAISDTESSVMLIDCAKMASIWSLEDAQHRWKRALLRKASKEKGIRGDLDPGWNARDEEFEPGKSHLLHYTTLHTQPWRPFPERFVYQKGSHTQLWHDLEREAIAKGFEFFRREAPSRAFQSRLERQRTLPQSEMGSGIGISGEVSGAVEALTRRTKSRTLLELSPDVSGDGVQRPGRFGLDSERRVGLLEWLAGQGEEESVDGMICVDGLEALPVWDIPWLIDALFEKAKRFVFVAVRCPESSPRRRFLLPPQGTTHTPEWWRSHFEAASARHPELSWELITARGAAFDSDRIHVRRGGRRPDSTPPRVWTLTDGEPGNETQVAALVSALGWPSEAITPVLSPMAELPFMHLGAHLRGLRKDGRGRAALQPPWPDLLIVAGRRAAAAARWVRRAARGRTLVVAIGNKTATPADGVDLALTRKGAALFPHPHRFEIEQPLVSAGPSARPSARWRERIAAISGPRIALLLGSGTRRLGLDRASAEAFGRLVAESAAGLGASILVSASRHTSAEVLEGCLRGVGNAALVHHETRDQRPEESGWSAILEAADLFVIAGLGETTLAEICATGRPVFLAPQLRTSSSLFLRIRDGVAAAIVARAEARPANDRGTTRPQQGLELICARWVAGGFIRPRRNVDALRGRLVRNGHARLLRAPIHAGDLEGFAVATPTEVDAVADHVRHMFGLGAGEETNRDETNDL
jgi:mitochondrial fission protein ELM1